MAADPLLIALASTAAATVGGGAVWFLGHRRRQALADSLVAIRAERDQLLTLRSDAERERGRLQEQIEQLRQQSAEQQNQHAALAARAEEREAGLKAQIEQFDASRALLRAEFENLSREFLAARDKELRAHNRDSLSSVLKPLADKIDGFQHRVNQVHGDMERSTATLTEQIRGLAQVGLNMSEEAGNLTRALKGDKKLVGNWGEAQLERTLELAGLQPGEHYQAQASFRTEEGQRQVPDFVVYLPGGKHLVVDSKVSLVDYEKAIAADTDDVREAALSRHAAAVRAHIDSLADKAYAQLPGIESPDFVLMFMPVEPAYIEVMKHHRDLFSHGYQRGVVMVSHSTLMPILRTVSNLWMMERSNTEAREISERAGEIFNAVCLVAERLQGLGASLQTVSRKYNDTVTAMVGRQGLHGKVERFQSLSHKATRQFPDKLNTLSTDTDAHHLSIATGTADRDPNSEN